MLATDGIGRPLLHMHLQTLERRAGVLRSDLDVPAAAAGLIALSKGVHLLMVMRPDAVPDGLDAETERWLTGLSDAGAG